MSSAPDDAVNRAAEEMLIRVILEIRWLELPVAGPFLVTDNVAQDERIAGHVAVEREDMDDFPILQQGQDLAAMGLDRCQGMCMAFAAGVFADHVGAMNRGVGAGLYAQAPKLLMTIMEADNGVWPGDRLQEQGGFDLGYDFSSCHS
ncbi:hypothetical protein ACEUZ9_000995 [Paracoccus litorisediminis]|uniref:hypothetical protein n=1 Tax=Paracoccus litorisediminis TaxID=2006130 RepID=UPI00372FEF58